MTDPAALAGLRDLLLPPAPGGGWPPVLAALVLGALLALAARALRRPLRRDALAALAAAEALPGEERLAAQARLLRRVAEARLGPGAARLRGEAWLRALDGLFRTDAFTRGPGRALGDALYRPAPPGTAEAVAAALRPLLARLPC